MLAYLNNIWSAFSQFLNVVFLFGNPNESISGRCYGDNWTIPMKIINTIYFWQNNHCRGAFNTDRDWAIEYLEKVKKVNG